MKNFFKKLDAYPKVLEEYREKTLSGAIVSLICGLIILWLFISELSLYLSTEVKPQLYVDTTRGEKMRINLDVTFPSIPCAFLSLDTMDVSGEHQTDIAHNIFKKRMKDGKPIAVERQNIVGPPPTEKPKEGDEQGYCGSCYGSAEPGKCCNTCDDVREAYRLKGWSFSNPDGIAQCVREGFSQSIKEQEGEGCQVYGYLLVNKVAGNFHFAPGKSFQNNNMHVHDFQMFHQTSFNMSHHINSLSFGFDYPGIVNPLDGVQKLSLENGISVMYQYFIKIVPTRYANLEGTVLKTNQFSVTEHERNLQIGVSHGLPGVFFMYDLSPIMVEYTEVKKSFAHFLVGVCAIIGGVFTVAGIIDNFLYHGIRSLEKKIELGKLN